MFVTTMKKAGLAVMLMSLAACGAADRISNIGKAPEMTPIKDIKAPATQRSISLPMPENKPDKYQPNSLWRTGARAFFKDQRASNVGDILTVHINIADNAKIGNSTSRTRTTAEGANIANAAGAEQALKYGLYGHSAGANADSGSGTATNAAEAGANAYDPSSLLSAGSSSSYAGTGAVDRSEAINLTVAAIVTDVLPNGNLVIQGRQEVRVNFEKRELLIAGIVRPQDISSNNTIEHTQIAEARISYGGKGQLTDVQQPRYGTQLFDVIFPF
ncbi:flagellar basal body L-ring protein FlgH [Kordiimonas marina]|uniref:flagellar basal body L-ring protein FlgH n=1 Tax=Kordiimonas marina TaxID=2872312 RepID=UPI001FF12AE1|nr:flagellar basal body L-ring protein FlgH [Kordiimonas marina]MCJ9430338.1 flagellar basal body L-ring protein FlgH [Kordiimonas marina]